MPATFNDGLVKGKAAGGAIIKNRFVIYDPSDATGETVIQAIDANTTTAPLVGVSKFGVTTAEIAKGKGCSVVMDGRAIVTAGSALTPGTVVTTDADGKAVAAVSGDWVGGIVDEPAAAEDDYCTVTLACNGSTYKP